MIQGPRIFWTTYEFMPQLTILAIYVLMYKVTYGDLLISSPFPKKVWKKYDLINFSNFGQFWRSLAAARRRRRRRRYGRRPWAKWSKTDIFSKAHIFLLQWKYPKNCIIFTNRQKLPSTSLLQKLKSHSYYWYNRWFKKYADLESPCRWLKNTTNLESP